MRSHFSEKRSGDCTRLSRLGEDYEISGGKKYAGDLVDRLVAHGPVHEDNALVLEIFIPEFQQLSGTFRVVRAVEVDRWALAEAFQASGPSDGPNALLDRFARDWKSACCKNPRSG